MNDKLTFALGFATVATVGIAGFMLYGAGLFRADGGFLKLEDLDHVGSFLSGTFTPIAIAWAARSFLQQRAQSEAELQAVRDQQAQDRRIRLEDGNPTIQVEKGGFVQSVGFNVFARFFIRNFGETARKYRIAYRFVYIESGALASSSDTTTTSALARNDSREIEVKFDPHTPFNPSDVAGRIVVYAERLDGEVSTFTFQIRRAFEVGPALHKLAVPNLKLTDDVDLSRIEW